MAYLISQLNGIKKFTYHLNFKTLLSTLYFLYIAKNQCPRLFNDIKSKIFIKLKNIYHTLYFTVIARETIQTRTGVRGSVHSTFSSVLTRIGETWGIS